ncbi:hypothetical protein VI817_007930 [Penicillium citrinum]|nr:hypothetical protein VI817_007930 [Penicillium citrinum]
MANTTFRLGSFRAWDPFHDKQQPPRHNEDTCRYPSPVSMTAPGPQVSRDEASAVPPENAGHIQRHPLPARPPVEVCLDDKSPPDTQFSQTDRETSQVVLPGYDLNDQTQISQSLSPTWGPEEPRDVNIDPALNHGSLSPDDSREIEETVVFEGSSTAAPPFSIGSQCLGADVVPKTVENETEPLATSHHEKTQRIKRPNPRKKKAMDGCNQFANEGAYRPSRQNFSFATLRSQFLCMPVGERLQFLSWLFEGALSHCVPSTCTDTGFPNASSYEMLSETNVMRDDCQKIPSAATGARHSPLNHIGPLGLDLAREKPLSGSTRCDLPELDEDEYEIEKILKHRKNASGSTSYLVRWKGYEDVESTWEPYVSVRDTAALDDYEMHLASKRSPHIPRNKNRISKTAVRGNVFGSNSSSSCRISQAHEKKVSRRNLSWTLAEARLIAHLRLELGLSWNQVYNRFADEFPGRTQASMQIFWSKKAREMLQQV